MIKLDALLCDRQNEHARAMYQAPPLASATRVDKISAVPYTFHWAALLIRTAKS
jgi:hypothetical protein